LHFTLQKRRAVGCYGGERVVAAERPPQPSLHTQPLFICMLPWNRRQHAKPCHNKITCPNPLRQTDHKAGLCPLAKGARLRQRPGYTTLVKFWPSFFAHWHASPYFGTQACFPETEVAWVALRGADVFLRRGVLILVRQSFVSTARWLRCTALGSR
jgi:hypothetical protein